MKSATKEELVALNRLVRSYGEAFREAMSAPQDVWFEPESCAARAAELDEHARDLLDTLLMAAPAGAAVETRFRSLVEAHGEALWRGGFLLPRTHPTPGSRLDPRHYAATCRTNPALIARRPMAEKLSPPNPLPNHASTPASDVRFDAAVVAATLEAGPLNLSQDGTPRRDALERRLTSLGADRERWEQALRYARAAGLVRPSAGQLLGYPESRPRRPADPSALLTEPAAGRALLALLGKEWIDLSACSELLQQRCRNVLYGPAERYPHRPMPIDDEGWGRVELPALQAAAAGLHSLRALDAVVDASGVSAVRAATPPPRLPYGFMLTPDLDVLVAPGELQARDYGRLCRMAPYVDGDRVYRHRLTREGIAADLRAGHADAKDFLTEHSRTGLPQSVAATIDGWTRSTGRLTLLSGATVVEQDGVFSIVSSAPRGRVIDYAAAPPARVTWVDIPDGLGELHVAFGEDALSVRHVIARVSEPLPAGETMHRYALVPGKPEDAAAALARLEPFFDGDLPGPLEVSVRAAAEPVVGSATAATIVSFEAPLMTALRRDLIAGPLLARTIDAEHSAVVEADVNKLRTRLATLGLTLS